MLLPLQNFTGLVESMAAGVQGSAAQLIDLTVGSVLRALLEACASIALWLQWLILQVLSMTRAATSTGTDLDSWMADFSFVRLPGAMATGAVTFSRYSTGIGTTIPVGQTVSTADGTQSFTVLADPGNAAWNGANGFFLAPAASSVTVPVQATQAGVAGNVQPGTVVLLTQPLPGVDTATNPAAFTGGVDSEADAPFRARFQAYINSRSLGTGLAVQAAIAALRQGLRYSVSENSDSAGNFLAGHFCVVLDDGTGSPPATLLTEGSQAVEQVRPIGATYSVVAPATMPVSVAMTVSTSNPLIAAAVKASIGNAITAYIQGLPIAGRLAVSMLEAIAHNSDPSVLSVSGTAVNGAAIDIVLPWNAVFVVQTVTVS